MKQSKDTKDTSSTKKTMKKISNTSNPKPPDFGSKKEFLDIKIPVYAYNYYKYYFETETVNIKYNIYLEEKARNFEKLAELRYKYGKEEMAYMIFKILERWINDDQKTKIIKITKST